MFDFKLLVVFKPHWETWVDSELMRPKRSPPLSWTLLMNSVLMSLSVCVFRKDGRLPAGVSVKEDRLLFVRPLNVTDDGVYICQTANRMGSTKAQFKVEIGSKCFICWRNEWHTTRSSELNPHTSLRDVLLWCHRVYEHYWINSLIWYSMLFWLILVKPCLRVSGFILYRD